MADEDSPETSPAADDSPALKKDTVRITIPPQQQETPMVKRETVHIGLAPKKETTTIAGATPLADTSAPVSPPPAATRPMMPPPSAPPRPPAAPGMPPLAGARPPGMPPIAPKPMAPVTAPKAAGYAEVKPVTIKAAPKKETARIQVAPTQKLPPQATVRLSQPSQSLSAGPAPAIRPAAAPAATADAAAGEDKIVTILSWAAVAISLAAAALGYMAYSA